MDAMRAEFLIFPLVFFFVFVCVALYVKSLDIFIAEIYGNECVCVLMFIVVFVVVGWDARRRL